jgi:hypothetical protein
MDTSPTPTPRPRARRAHPIDLAVTVTTDAPRTSEWAALWRRLLGPVPTPEPDAAEPPARLPAQHGEAGSE